MRLTHTLLILDDLLTIPSEHTLVSFMVEVGLLALEVLSKTETP